MCFKKNGVTVLSVSLLVLEKVVRFSKGSVFPCLSFLPHISSFQMNELTWSVRCGWYLSLPCSWRFSWFSLSLRYASFIRKCSLPNLLASLFMPSFCRKIRICFLSSNTLDSTLPWESHLASLWNSTAVLSAPISSHNEVVISMVWFWCSWPR